MSEYLQQLLKKLDDFHDRKTSAEQKILAAKAEALYAEKAITNLQILIEMEEREIGVVNGQLNLRSQVVSMLEKSSVVDSASLLEVLLHVMGDREQHTLDDLVHRARVFGYDFGNKAPARSVNATLLGALSASPPRVERVLGGAWRLPTEEHEDL